MNPSTTIEQFGSAVFRKGSNELFSTGDFHYAPPIFLFPNEALDYIQKHLTSVEQDHAEIRRIHYRLEIEVA